MSNKQFNNLHDISELHLKQTNNYMCQRHSDHAAKQSLCYVS